jgi:GT2 family glycosyltransferase
MDQRERPHPRVAIVVLNYNGLEDTCLCLKSLGALDPAPHRVILVDNASAIDPEAAARALMPDLVYIRTDRNLGYAGGNNRGIERALELGADFVIVLNNDTTVARDLLAGLLDAFARDPAIGIVGPVINFLDEPERVMTDGVLFNPGPGTVFFHRVTVPLDARPPALVPVDIVNGCCMMIRREVLRSAGAFDESFFIVHEESDLCLRAARAGFRLAVLGRTLVWHKGSSSFERSGRQLQRYYDQRNLYFLLRRHTGHVSRSRPFGVSRRHWLRYGFYRYDIELEAAKPAAARAILEGIHDALTATSGPRQDRGRLGLGALGATFRLGRTVSRALRPWRRSISKAAPGPTHTTSG